MLITLRHKMTLVAVLYFSEGFPFGTVWDVLPVYFRFSGVSLEAIGLLSLAGLPWTFKFLWSPLVDYFGRIRDWIWSVQFLLAASLVSFAFVDPAGPSVWLWVAILGIATLSATQDIAIDAYTIRILSREQMGFANGVRVSAYRAALIVSGGALVAVAGWLGWNFVFLTSAGVMAACGVLVLGMPRTGDVRNDHPSDVFWKPFVDFLARPKAVRALLFVLLFKLGDMAMGPMVRPFWVDRGLSTSEIGLITGTVGLLAAVAGALVGGAYTSRKGIFRGLWVLGLWQAVSNLGYAAVARFPESGHWGVYGASMVESFCGGLGTASFLAYLMAVCRKDMAATQYALLTALFGLARTVSGVSSGWATVHLGYASYFGFTFFLALPAYLLLPSAKTWLDRAPGASEEHQA